MSGSPGRPLAGTRPFRYDLRMSLLLVDTLRFARGWLRPRTTLREREVPVLPEESSTPVPATLVEPSESGPLPGWVVLHGITRPGRAHAGLLRFVRALATTGRRVLVPEIPEWRDMDFAPARAQSIIRGAVDQLASDPDSTEGGVVLLGFSFGAPQALVVASDPAFRGRVRGVVGWGGYADLERTFRFLCTGRHTLNGEVHHQRPDPYGRWVIGANCLPLVPGLKGSRPVASALRALAVEAGERQVMAWDPSLERVRSQLRTGLPRTLRGLFDLFAPPDAALPPAESVEELTRTLAGAARRQLPLLDPLGTIEGIRAPVRLLHGRSDQLIPCSETPALARALERRAPDLEWALTGLFAHSGGASGVGPVARMREAIEFGRVLGDVISIGES